MPSSKTKGKRASAKKPVVKPRATTKGKGKGKATSVTRRRSVRKNASKKCTKCHTSMGVSTPDQCACKYLVGAKRVGKDGKTMYVVKSNANKKLFWSTAIDAKKKAPAKKRAAPRRLSAPTGEHRDLLATSEKRAQFSSALKQFKDEKKSADYRLMEKKYIKSDHSVVHTVVQKLGKLIVKKFKLLEDSPNVDIKIEMKNGSKTWGFSDTIKKIEGSAKDLLRLMLEKYTKYSEFNAFYNNFFRALKKSGDKLFASSSGGVYIENSKGDNLHDWLAGAMEDKQKTIDEMSFE